MFSLLLLTCISFALALILTRICRTIAVAAGLVDLPDRKRKTHTAPIPRVGGVAVGLSYLGAYAVLLPLGGVMAVAENLTAVWHLFPAVAAVFLTGLADDLWNLRPWHKLIGETGAALLAYGAGVRITCVAGQDLPVWLGAGVTVVWLVACANALNLIDGLDGLAAGVGLFAAVTTFIAALSYGDRNLALATAPLIGALLGFLRYNFHPASIFLGDCGSLLIGFLLGCYAVLWSGKSATLLGMTAPAITLALPIMDTLLSIFRRFLRGQPIFGADRGHIHHRLLDRGLTPRRASLVLYGCCAVAATLSLLQSALHHSYGGLLVVLFCLIAAAGISYLRYIEFAIAGRLLARGTFRCQVNTHVRLANLNAALEKAHDAAECWKALRDTCLHLGFDEVKLSVSGVEYHERFRENAQDSWSVRIPLGGSESFVHLLRRFDSLAPEAVGALADEVRRSLAPKLPVFGQSGLLKLIHITGTANGRGYSEKSVTYNETSRVMDFSTAVCSKRPRPNQHGFRTMGWAAHWLH